jgi:heme o synthase
MDATTNPAITGTPMPAEWRDFFTLTKPRVMTLVIFTAICGVLAAPGSIHPVLGFTAILAISMGAGGSAALNHWWEADLDKGMKRTMSRPLPAGRMRREDARDFGIFLSAVSVGLMGLAIGWLAAALLAVAVVYYAVIYTMWLKPRTPQNIVIGGGAGAFPPMIGWIAVTGEVTAMPVLLFAIIFFWTPPHFWALALFVQSDYAKVGIPMMPVVAGRKIDAPPDMVVHAGAHPDCGCSMDDWRHQLDLRDDGGDPVGAVYLAGMACWCANARGRGHDAAGKALVQIQHLLPVRAVCRAGG